MPLVARPMPEAAPVITYVRAILSLLLNRGFVVLGPISEYAYLFFSLLSVYCVIQPRRLRAIRLPQLGAPTLTRWLRDAHTVDGIVKGLKQPDWPADPWVALQQLALRVSQGCALR